MAAAHEPAFIFTGDLDTDAAHTSKPLSNMYLTSSPESRSTSTGSLSPLPSMAEGEIDCGGLPDFDYPVPFIVRNTFIDTPLARPISLDEFLEERRVHSCPVEAPPGLGSDVGGLPMPTGAGSLPQHVNLGNSVMDSALAAAASASAAVAAATRCWMQPLMQRQVHAQQLPSSPMQTPPVQGLQAPVLRLADAIGEPEFGSPMLPTLGSAGHRIGNCKPCAFYHTKGCGNGTQCQFCHLCPAGEKKRRQKQKGAFERDFRRMGMAPDA